MAISTSAPRVTRRAVLAGLAAAAAVPRAGRAAPEGLAAILDRSRLGAETGFAVADAATGAMIEAHQGHIDRPPASTAKIVTALFALDRLGPAHRVETRVVDDGDALVLVGGGDPLVDTDVLGALAVEAAAAVPRSPRRLLVDASALPAVQEIASDQPAPAGYNPSISGLNLNFNRVHLAWEPGGTGTKLRLSAPGLRFEADAPSIAVELAGEGPPRHRIEDGREIWTFAAASLRGRGSLWLPVRAPAVYAGETFRALAGRAGLALGPPAHGPAGEGRTLAAHRGPPLEAVMRGMLRHSTNLTAEATGLAAARAGGAAAAGLAASAGEMSAWARARYGLRRVALVNHSGLSARSAMTATEMVRLLVAAAARDGLQGMLRERPLVDAAGAAAATQGVRILAKTGTLDFVSTLAGYIEGPGGRRRVFAIFAADLAARAAIPPAARDDPPGAAAWARRARAQEQALLRRWGGLA